MRWRHWHGIIRHFRKWQSFNGGINKKEATDRLNDCYQSQYFRESIPYMRAHGSLDEKIETYFMQSWLHPLFKPVYGLVVLAANLKKKVLG